MTRNKGALTPAAVDRGWPHQVALPESRATGAHHAEIEAFCRGLSKSPLGHAVHWGKETWQVHCFADRDHADAFRIRFDGVAFDPRDRGRGTKWMRWNRPKPWT